MTFFKRAFLTAVAAATFIVPSQAASVTWDFTGAWSTTNFGPHGTTLTGSLTFNSAASVTTFGPTYGFFIPTSISFTVSGYPGSVTYTGSNLFVEQYNNENSSYDMFKVSGNVSVSNPNNISSIIWQSFALTLYDPSQTLLNSVTVPTTVPNLAAAPVKNVSLIYNQGQYYDNYNLTSLTEAPAVPEPASMGLFALGLAGVAVTAVRKRYTTR